ncbi:MAG: hypothetical protein U0234_12515 [Sandaracinus sp.]
MFSRECAEYDVTTPQGTTVMLLANHFKSRIGGASGKLRERQAKRVKATYESIVARRQKNVVVLADLNDDVSSTWIAPLVTQTDLKDITTHPKYVGDGRNGTYGNGTDNDKLDWILLSPALWSKVKAGGIERRGVWGGAHGTLFPHLPEITKPGQAASDHAALWAEVEV